MGDHFDFVCYSKTLTHIVVHLSAHACESYGHLLQF